MKILLDRDNNKLSAHISTELKAVITISGDDGDPYSFMCYTFEDIDDIDFLISRLQELKDNFPSEQLDK